MRTLHPPFIFRSNAIAAPARHSHLTRTQTLPYTASSKKKAAALANFSGDKQTNTRRDIISTYIHRLWRRIRIAYPDAGQIEMEGGGGEEIAFFDVETTVPGRGSGEGHSLLEFGAIVCSRRLVEVGSYSTLIRPTDLSAISAVSIRCNGITAETVASAPSFLEVADEVFSILHGRVWAGHNIVRFDCPRIREAFAEIGRDPPEPKGIIDTLPLLTQRFGRRAGNMKMASLASYFGLGQQKHRSLDDVRMNLEVLKYCATVLFLEASLPDVFSINTLVNENTAARNPCDTTAPCERSTPMLNSPSNLFCKTIPEVNDRAGSIIPAPEKDCSNLISDIEQMRIDPVQPDAAVLGKSEANSPEMVCTTIPTSEGCSGFAGFQEPEEVSTQYISAPIVPFSKWGPKILVFHRDCPLQLCCMGLRVQFGPNKKFMDHAGRPKLSIVVDAPESLSEVLGVCDKLAQVSSQIAGSKSEWRPVIVKSGYSNSSSIRLHIPVVANGDAAIYSTEIYQKEPSGNMQKLVFSNYDDVELDSLFVPGATLDAYFCVDTYDYQLHAGIRLIAKRLVLHSK
uniref:Protein NEN1 n=1 Tax=Elaeis guineensis var. tenera TaxID=51953 RepID=A0A6I9QYA1_ELAGV|nr:protein NEN1 [Elaeis guineensis]